MANKGIIYCLKCPIKNDIKYIGKTTQKLEQRFNEHISQSKMFMNKKTQPYKINKKISWIMSLLKNEIKPVIEVLDLVDVKDLDFFEEHYINLFKSWGFDLKNTDKSYTFKEYHKKGSKKGCILSKEHKDKITETLKLHYQNNISKIKGIKKNETIIEKRCFTLLTKNLTKYNLDMNDIELLQNDYISSGLSLRKFSLLKNLPYSFIRNVIVVKKYNILKNE